MNPQSDSRSNRTCRWRARLLAATSSVCIAVPIGALAELPVPCGTCGGAAFVHSGAASYNVTGNTGRVAQSTERAILNWQSFNVGAQNRVEFNQPSRTSATLNRIHQADPSRILGSIDANGQVFLINSNGFVFGSGARVDTRAFTASTLDVSDQVFNNLGITGAINANPTEATTAALPAFEGTPAAGARIDIESGARITGTDRVVVIAPEVVNRGTIEVPDGQAILAGSHDKVYLAADSELRGLLVEVDTGGSVSNLGEILTERGNTTLVGLAVNQAGRIRASTSVNVNGTIRLLARDKADRTKFNVNNGARTPVATRAGTLTLAPGSMTEIVPDTTSPTARDAQPQARSKIETMARTTHVQRDARVVATGGTVDMLATSRPDTPLGGGDTGARILVDQGATIDVSGDTTASVPMARNQGRVKLFGNELAGAPLQRNGILRGKEIAFDLRRGTAIANVSQAYNNVDRSIGERLASGGTVSLRSEGDVILQSGARVDFSGGQISVEEGYLETTRLLRAGRVVDISEASPDVLYDGIFGSLDVLHRKWGVEESYAIFVDGNASVFNPGYVEAKDAGSLTVAAATNVVLNGILVGRSEPGLWQRKAPGAVAGTMRPYDEMPLGGKLSLSRGGDVSATNLVLGNGLRDDQPLFDLSSILPADAPTRLAATMFAGEGPNRIEVTSAGRIMFEPDLDLDLGPAGSLKAVATRIAAAGQLHAPGGSLRLESDATATDVGDITVAAGTRLDVSGRWTNDRAGSPVRSAPIVTAGGHIDLISEGDLALAPGAILDVSAGASRNQRGVVEFGAPGEITLTAKNPASTTAPTLTLGAELRGYGFDAGGKLALNAGGFVIGSETGTAPGVVPLTAGLFAAGGFSTHALATDRTGVRIIDGTRVTVSPEIRQLSPAAFTAESGTLIEAISSLVRPLPYLQTPSHFSARLARAPGVADAQGSIVIGNGSTLEVQPGGTIGLTTDTDLYLGGTLRAPGGTIALSLLNPDSTNETGYRAEQSLYLGATAVLDAAGVARIEADRSGRRVGSIMDGGHVTLHTQRGHVIAAPGSRIDVSGAAGELDFLNGETFGATTSTRIGSDAGTLTVRAAESIHLAGSLAGTGGSATARGGRLGLVLDPRERDPGDVVLTNFQNNALPPGQRPFPRSRRRIIVGTGRDEVRAPGVPVPDQDSGIARLNPATQLAGAGFDDLQLHTEPVVSFSAVDQPGEIAFEDGASLFAGRRITLDATVISATRGHATIGAPLLEIGPTNPLFRPVVVPQAGDGTLTFRAQHLDLRSHTVFDGLIATADVSALNFVSSGDVRLVGRRFGGETQRNTFGSLTTLADVSLDAARLYPATLTAFTFDLLRNDSRLRIGNPGTVSRGAPHSVAGELTVNAGVIESSGVSVAPFGRVAFNARERIELAAGSVTSVSGIGLEALFGRSEFGTDWIYPLGDVTRVIDQVPLRNVTLNAPVVSLRGSSTVDVRGGGELATYEFIPGPGGPLDILTSDNPAGAFAILPALDTAFGIFDPLESTAAGIAVGSVITLRGHAQLADGTYARLPARFALLPGAFLVTPLAGFTDLAPFATPLFADGTALVAGKFGDAGTGNLAARWQGFAIENGSQVRENAEYREPTASGFFGQRGTGVPADAGQLTLRASSRIDLGGALLAANGAGGRGAFVDLAATNLALVNARTGNAGVVEVIAGDLAKFSDASLLLGGTRTLGTESIDLDVVAETVEVAPDTQLAAREVLLAGRQTVRIGAGAVLASAGTASDRAPRRHATVGDGAFARVSADSQIAFTRTGVQGLGGDLHIEPGASLRGTGSLTLEATRDFTSRGRLSTDGSLRLAASLINLGEAPANAGGLSLDSAQLRGLVADELYFRAADSINFYDATTLSGRRLTFDTPNLRGFLGASDGQAVLAADEMVLTNTGPRTTVAAGSGLGQLDLTANLLTLAGGDLTIEGFSSTRINASERVMFAAQSDSRVTADLEIRTPVIASSAGATAALRVDGAFRTAGQPVAGPAQSGLGARVTIAADLIEHRSRFDLPSGILELTATGTGGIRFGSGSAIDVAGIDLDYRGIAATTAGGRIRALASLGGIVIESGAVLNLDGGALGGKAGTLELKAAGVLDIATTAVLRGVAGTDADGGAFNVAAERLAGDFSQLNDRLNVAGFTRARAFAFTAGDLALAAGSVITARDVLIDVAGGAFAIDGTISADGTRAGRARLYARDELTVGGTARLSARALERGGEGGVFELGTHGGDVSLAAGARVDVSGQDAQGQAAASGTVRLRAPQIGTTGIAVSALDGIVAGTSGIELEAVRSYAANTVDAGLIGTIASDNQAYFANAAQILAGVNAANGLPLRLVPGVEVASPGDLTIASPWNLLGQRFDGRGGILTLRATGNLRFDQTLSDGVSNERVDGSTRVGLRDLAQPGESWSYRLAAGADIDAGNPLAITGTLGDLRIGNNRRVLTGTGDIHAAAAGDFVLEGTNSALYTLGRARGTGAITAFEAEILLGGDFVELGGDVEITAGGSLIGFEGVAGTTAAARVLPDWLPRLNGVRAPITGLRAIDYPVAWAIAHSRFVGVGALGGGDVRLSAGADLESLRVALPTNARPESLADGDLAIAGGGDLTVDVGGSIRSGLFLIDRGRGEIDVGGQLTTDSARTPLAPVLAVGDAALAFHARNGINLQTAFNPTMAQPHPRQGNAANATDAARAQRATFFFTYGEDSRVELETLAGDILLAADGTPIAQAYQGSSTANGDRTIDGAALTVLPGTLHARSGAGAILVQGNLQLFPSPRGDLTLLAGTDVRPLGGATVLMSDADVSLLPSVSSPSLVASGIALSRVLAGHAPVPVHAGDRSRAALVARDGTLGSSGLDTLSVTLAKQAYLAAGVDIANISLEVQHAQDATVQRTVSIPVDGLLGRLERALSVNNLAEGLSDSERLDSLSAEALGLAPVANERRRDLQRRKIDVIYALLGEASPSGASASDVLVDGLPVASLGDARRRSLLENAVAAIFARDSLTAGTLLGLSAEFATARTEARINPTLPIQDAARTDRTELDAGRDITYTTPRRPDGNLSTNSARIRVAGAGTLDLVAGRDIDLGSSSGVETVGNLQNAALPARGADLSLLTGNVLPPQLEAFADAYLRPGRRYDGYLLNALGLGEAIALDPARRAAADTAFAALPVAARRELVMNAFYGELTAGTTGTPADYTRSNLAIATLLPLPGVGALADIPGIGMSFPAVSSLTELVARELRLETNLTVDAARNRVIDKLLLAAEKQSNDLSQAADRARRAADGEQASALDLQRIDIDGRLRPALAALRSGGGDFAAEGPARLLGLDDRAGSVKSLLSRVSTLDGGNLNFLVPGGFVNAGVASSGTLTKDPSEIGIVAQGLGDIRAFTADDFEVNSSRVFALDGGDIFILSAIGDIDAGRGARSALAIPPPVTTFDAQGNVIIEFPAAIAGSGIQAAVSTPGRPPGDVALVAPLGVVDAGDAGISSAGNLTITATAVLGADNISFGGNATGVPTTAVSVPVGLASASSAAGSATRAANGGAAGSQSQASDDAVTRNLESALVSMISVQFIGFGE